MWGNFLNVHTLFYFIYFARFEIFIDEDEGREEYGLLKPLLKNPDWKRNKTVWLAGAHQINAKFNSENETKSKWECN